MLENRNDKGNLEVTADLQIRIDQLGAGTWQEYRKKGGTLLVPPQIKVDEFPAACPKDKLTENILTKLNEKDFGKLGFRVADKKILTNLIQQESPRPTPKNEQFLREVTRAAVRASIEESANRPLPYPNGIVSKLSKMPGYRVLLSYVEKNYGFDFPHPAEATYVVHMDKLPEELNFSDKYKCVGPYMACHNPGCKKAFDKKTKAWRNNEVEFNQENLGSCVEARFLKCDCCGEITILVHQND